MKLLTVLALLFASPALADQDEMAAGGGREATYYTCSACHAIRLVTQQRLSRDRWDHLLDWMQAEQAMPPLADKERAEILDYLESHYGPASEGGKTKRRR